MFFILTCLALALVYTPFRMHLTPCVPVETLVTIDIIIQMKLAPIMVYTPFEMHMALTS
jgi:hypothetical protein